MVKQSQSSQINLYSTLKTTRAASLSSPYSVWFDCLDVTAPLVVCVVIFAFHPVLSPLRRFLLL